MICLPSVCWEQGVGRQDLAPGAATCFYIWWEDVIQFQNMRFRWIEKENAITGDVFPNSLVSMTNSTCSTYHLLQALSC